MAKQNALQKIESHEKLCRIMQKLTHDKINIIEDRVKRLEKILLICTGSLITGMGYLIITMLGLQSLQTQKNRYKYKLYDLQINFDYF